MDQEPLSPFYHSTKKTTPIVPPVAETATEEKPATRVPEILSEERILEYLRRILPRYMEQYPDTAEVRQRFREERQKVYPNHHHLIEQVLSEMLPEEQGALPVSVPEEPTIPEPKNIIPASETDNDPHAATVPTLFLPAKPIPTQETVYIDTLSEPETGETHHPYNVDIEEPKNMLSVSETENETLPVYETLDTWLDEVLSEIPEPQHVDIPHWKSQQLKTAHEQKLTKRQVERRFLKDKMRYYVDSNPTEEFSVKVLCALFPERKADTMTALVKELWKEGLVKGRIEVRTLSRRPKKSTCSYVITSLANPSTHYYTQFPEDNLWFKKKKIGTRHSSSEPDS